MFICLLSVRSFAFGKIDFIKYKGKKTHWQLATRKMLESCNIHDLLGTCNILVGWKKVASDLLILLLKLKNHYLPPLVIKGF